MRSTPTARCRSTAAARTTLAAEFGTPVLVVAERTLRARAREYADELVSRWPNSRVVFASKAFPCTAVQRVMVEEGLGLDVAGGGEILTALKAGVDPALIVLHGNAKSDEEIAMAVEHGIGLVVVDNSDDVDRLEATVPAGRSQDVLVRIIPGRHRGHARARPDRPRGLEVRPVPRRRGPADQADRAQLAAADAGPARPRRFADSRSASRSPTRSRRSRSSASSRSTTSAAVWAPGTPGPTKPPTVGAYLDALIGAAREHLPAEAQLIIEPGRSMVAVAATTIYRVTTVKRGAVTFVAVDGGMGDNLEVALFDQRFEAGIVGRFDGPDTETVTVVGRHCESGDVLVDGVPLSAPTVGDLLAVPATGAYCYTMANNYNGNRRIPVVFVNDGDARLVVRRETWDDLMARDVE